MVVFHPGDPRRFFWPTRCAGRQRLDAGMNPKRGTALRASLAQCRPVARVPNPERTEVGDEIDRRAIWRMMDQLTGGLDVQEVLQDYPVKVWTHSDDLTVPS
jgi:hypothetical protein